MTISNETRAKVIAQYIGQEFVDKYEAYPKYKYVLIGVCKSEYQVDSEDVWLALSNGNEFPVEGIQFTSIRPLSELSNEEAIEVTKILVPNFHVHHNVKEGRYFIDQFLKNGFDMYTVQAITIYQYLQSIGIDLPQFLLGGKTLKEAGLACYE